MANDEQIVKEAEYYINNDVSVDEASKHLGISRRTFQLHMKRLEEINPVVFNLFVEKKNGNVIRGNIRGGTIGKRKPNWTKEEALDMANQIIAGEMTYDQAEEKTGIPKSTIYEMTHNGVTDDTVLSLLYCLSEANRRGMSLSEFKQQHSETHVASDLIAQDLAEQSLPKKGKK